MDKFKQYLNEHANNLGNDEPGNGVWRNIEAAIPVKHHVRSITHWYKYAAAACVIAIGAFAVGRLTMQPVTLVKYQTVYVKQPAAVPAPVTKLALAVAVKPAHSSRKQKREGNAQISLALIGQLRSIYVSERIDAVMKMTDKGDFNSSNLKMLALALNEDPNTNVRLTIINELRPFAANQNVQTILISALKKQDDTIVQSSIVDLLINVRSKQSIPQMIALLDDKNTDAMVQNKIKGGIESFLY